MVTTYRSRERILKGFGRLLMFMGLKGYNLPIQREDTERLMTPNEN